MPSSRLWDGQFDASDRGFHQQVLELVNARATRKQLGQKFEGFSLVRDDGGNLAAINFRFLGTNGHGASHTVNPFMRDIVAELRSKRGIAPVARPKDMFGEL